MIRERHGINNALKVDGVRSNDYQAVDITDGSGCTYISLSTAAHPAKLDPEQAEFLARQLIASAKRARQETSKP